jgi:hypothetical protein
MGVKGCTLSAGFACPDGSLAQLIEGNTKTKGLAQIRFGGPSVSKKATSPVGEQVPQHSSPRPSPQFLGTTEQLTYPPIHGERSALADR